MLKWPRATKNLALLVKDSYELQGQENDNVYYLQIHTEAPLHNTSNVETFPESSFKPLKPDCLI